MKLVSHSLTAEKMASKETLKKPKLEQQDTLLYKWFLAVRPKGKLVMGPMVTEKTKNFAQNLNVAKFNVHCSDVWLRNIKSCIDLEDLV